MRFSIVMASYLGKYKRAATNRDKKIVRAVQSALDQSFRDFELVIVADGCTQTMKIVKENFLGKTDKIKLIMIKKQKMWSGIPRNAGIQNATGDWVTYLDIDDAIGRDHLKIIDQGIKENPDMDWVWYNDLSYNVKQERFDEHEIFINKKGKCGTSNITHKKGLAWWDMGATYLHDWSFISNLKLASDKFCKIQTPQYQVLHVPHLLDV